MKYMICLATVLLLLLPVRASEDTYAVRTIPEELKVASNAVVRNNEQKLIIQPDGQIMMHSLYAITVLNEGGEDNAIFLGPYDQYTRLKHVRGWIYDCEGKKQEILRGDDILDLSMISSYSLYEDSRIKVIDPEYHEYPYTVEYISTYVFKSFLDLPDWIVYPGYHVSVEHSVFEIIASNDDAFRYYPCNLDIEPSVSETGEGLSYRWELNHCPALVPESLSRGIREISPRLCVSPSEFEYGGIPGSMGDWRSFGRWISRLTEDKHELDAEETRYAQSLVAGVESEREKASILYRYMQDKVRYVNIKLGAGGFEPIPARKVSEVGYGDCKALSNYMQALLEAAGIRSIYTLVRSGDQHPRIIRDFPSQQFNHAILAVPLEADTLWLECTSQRLPAGYLGSFTDDRVVLLVTEQGGELAKTPVYGKHDNRRVLKAKCELNSSCAAFIDYRKEYLGIHYGTMLQRIQNLDRTGQKRDLQNRLRLSGFSISDFSYEFREQPEPVISESAGIVVPQLTSMQGEYIQLPATLLSEEIQLPVRTRNRTQSIFLKRGNTFIDSVLYVLPDNLSMLHIPESVQILGDFGSYSLEVAEVDGGILCKREFILNDGEYPPERFNEFYSFLRQARSADNQHLLLVRNL